MKGRGNKLIAEQKITGSQLGFLLLPLVIATAIITIPSVVTAYANQDAWLSVLLASVTGIWSILVVAALAKRYPGLTIVEYSLKILGKLIGKLWIVYLLYYLYVLIAVINRENLDFLITCQLPNTPAIVIDGVMMTMCGFAAYAGIEAMGRCVQFLIPINILFFLLLFILSIKEMDFNNLKPILEDIVPILKGAFVPSGWTGEVFFLAFLYPFLNQPNQGRKVGLLVIGGITVILMLVSLEAIAVMGQLTPKLTYSYFSATRFISVAQFIERLDPLVISMWMFGVFSKLSLVLFIFCLCTSQFFGLANYKSIVFPLTLLCIIGSQIITKNTADLHSFLLYTFPLIAVVTHNLIPSILLVADSIKKLQRAKTKDTAV